MEALKRASEQHPRLLAHHLLPLVRQVLQENNLDSKLSGNQVYYTA